MTKLKTQEINLTKEIIGINLKECFQCGKPKSTRHHAIPKELKPIKNITIPLCDKHKDIMHHIIKQLYFPKELRRKLGRLSKHLNDSSEIAKSVREDLKFHKKKCSLIT